MSRPKGTLDVANNFEAKFSASMDARLSVETRSELYEIEYGYRGMEVYVKDEDLHYRLINDLPAFTASWKPRSGDGSEFAEITESEIDEMFA